MATTTEKIGIKLRWLREKKGLSQQDVADRIGMTKQTIYKYEQGIVSISVKQLEEILNIYDVSLGKFLDDI